MAIEHTTHDSPSHTPGTPKGEEMSKTHKEAGRENQGRTARDATGVNVDTRGPIDPRMPDAPPA